MSPLRSRKVIAQITRIRTNDSELITGLTPKLLVHEGDEVKCGQALLTDKQTERISIPSPVSGKVKAIVRGDRRKLLRVVVETSDTNEQAEKKADSTLTLVERLCEAGLFCFMRQRPYDVIASPADNPKAIFVSAFSKMPLAANFSFVAKGEEELFKHALKALSEIAPAYVGIPSEDYISGLCSEGDVHVNIFDGPNPSGNVGVQINHICPVNKGEIVWTLSPQAVLFIGRWLETGKLNLSIKIAVAGSEVGTPQYVETIIGAPLSELVGNTGEHKRIINGNPLVGEAVANDDYLGAFASEVCVLPEGDDIHEAFGWIMPRLKQHSVSRSYLSWLMPGKKFAPDCRIKGGQRHMIMSGEYDRVFPMDIFAGYLIKAIITGDIDRQEALGIYEVAPEDFAVAEYVDSSKLELQRIVREGLDILRKENA